MNRMETKKIERATRIRSAAIKCFQANGFKNTSMAMIAEAADISVGSLYNYFENKDELLLQPIFESQPEYNNDIEEILSLQTTIEKRWQGIINIYISSFTRYGKRVWREFFSTVLSEKPELMQNITIIDQPFIAAMVKLLEMSEKQNSEMTAKLLYRLWLQNLLQWILSEDVKPENILMKFMIDLKTLGII